jgi:hypothetical protein
MLKLISFIALSFVLSGVAHSAESLTINGKSTSGLAIRGMVYFRATVKIPGVCASYGLSKSGKFLWHAKSKNVDFEAIDKADGSYTLTLDHKAPLGPCRWKFAGSQIEVFDPRVQVKPGEEYKIPTITIFIRDNVSSTEPNSDVALKCTTEKRFNRFIECEGLSNSGDIKAGPGNLKLDLL